MNRRAVLFRDNGEMALPNPHDAMLNGLSFEGGTAKLFLKVESEDIRLCVENVAFMFAEMLPEATIIFDISIVESTKDPTNFSRLVQDSLRSMAFDLEVTAALTIDTSYLGNLTLFGKFTPENIYVEEHSK